MSEATIFERNCGATTNYSYHVAVIEKGDTSLSTGNVLILDDDHGAAENPVPTLKWLSKNWLEVEYPVRARIFEKSSKVGKIQISYRKRP